MSLKGKNFFSLFDFTKEEILYLLSLSAKVKKERKEKIFPKRLKDKNILLLFEKTSTRTRLSFEISAKEEGANTVYIGKGVSQFGVKESVEDSAKVFGRFFDAIEYRGFSMETVKKIAENSGKVTWNGLTDDDHPTQILADLLTISEHTKKDLSEIKIAFVGDIRSNMANAWISGAYKIGFELLLLGPSALRPSDEVLEKATGANVKISEDLNELKGYDVIYTDIWASMGEEDKTEERVKLLSPFKVTTEMLEKTENEKTLFMHCLPSYYNFETETAKSFYEKGIDIREVDEAVFESKNSVVFDEAENRLHTIKAVMLATLSDEELL